MTDEEEISLARAQIIIDARRVVCARDAIYESAGSVGLFLMGDLEDSLIDLKRSLAVLDGWRRRMNEARKGLDT